MTTGKTIALIGQTFVGKVTSLLFNMLSRLVLTFLPRNKCLVISWLQSPSAVILEPKNIKALTVSITSPSLCHLSKRSYILASHVVDMGGHCATQCREPWQGWYRDMVLPFVKTARCQDGKMSRCQDGKMSRCQDGKMSRCQ